MRLESELTVCTYVAVSSTLILKHHVHVEVSSQAVKCKVDILGEVGSYIVQPFGILQLSYVNALILEMLLMNVFGNVFRFHFLNV